MRSHAKGRTGRARASHPPQPPQPPQPPPRQPPPPQPPQPPQPPHPRRHAQLLSPLCTPAAPAPAPAGVSRHHHQGPGNRAAAPPAKRDAEACRGVQRRAEARRGASRRGRAQGAQWARHACISSGPSGSVPTSSAASRRIAGTLSEGSISSVARISSACWTKPTRRPDPPVAEIESHGPTAVGLSGSACPRKRRSVKPAALPVQPRPDEICAWRTGRSLRPIAPPAFEFATVVNDSREYDARFSSPSKSFGRSSNAIFERTQRPFRPPPRRRELSLWRVRWSAGY